MQPDFDGPFQVGDLVTRDGTDIHRVVEADEGYGAMVVECVKAPRGGWCKVGEREHNMCGRYRRLGEVLDQSGQRAPLPMAMIDADDSRRHLPTRARTPGS
jgi:hypothetical protein